MRGVWGLVAIVMLGAPGCSGGGSVPVVHTDVGAAPDVVVSATEYTDWSLNMSGTTAKPAYGKGCRYKAVDGELWSLAADGANDMLAVTGPASGPITLDLQVTDGGVTVLAAQGVELSRVLTGKAYEQASGTLTFGSDAWTILDGTLCFESKLTDATADVAGEFSLIAQHDADGALRTVGGTFVMPVSAITGSDPLNVTGDAISLDLQ